MERSFKNLKHPNLISKYLDQKYIQGIFYKWFSVKGLRMIKQPFLWYNMSLGTYV